jgi:hypothetical protein
LKKIDIFGGNTPKSNKLIIPHDRSPSKKSQPFSLELWEQFGRPYLHTKSGLKLTDIVVFSNVVPDTFQIAGIVNHPEGRVLLTWRANGKIESIGGEMFTPMDLMMRID